MIIIPYMFTYEIKKSKFIAISYEIHSKDEVTKLLDTLRKEHKDARHIVYAFLINNGTSGGFSDDGEPSGTAGKPIFNLLQMKKASNKVVFVVRYFGGTKLGASGLIRAYIETAKHEIND